MGQPLDSDTDARVRARTQKGARLDLVRVASLSRRCELRLLRCQVTALLKSVLRSGMEMLDKWL